MLNHFHGLKVDAWLRRTNNIKLAALKVKLYEKAIVKNVKLIFIVYIVCLSKYI